MYTPLTSSSVTLSSNCSWNTTEPDSFSSEFPSTIIESMLKRPRLVLADISVIVISESGSSFEIVIDSLLVTLSPKFSTWAGLRTNGSFFVPVPPTNCGLDVVFSGSGPFLIPTITRRESPLSLATYINGINSRSSRSGKQTQIHHIVDELLSSSFLDSDFVATQVPSSSMFSGMLCESSGLEPHLSSSASDQLSPSSSSSALFPILSPSVSSHSVGSNLKSSSASETPSPSVSSSRASQVPSPSESVGKSESSNGSVPHSDSL